jgi:BirA family biotin operon repressor/biotin-[acetyl-CoA-carboxylase] ligase
MDYSANKHALLWHPDTRDPIVMQLLTIMSDGAFHSGESLGEALGVSRAAIWKQVHRWEQRGLEFDVVPGRGYRWRNPVEWWSEPALRKHISSHINTKITCMQIDVSIGSTNAAALEFLAREQRSGAVFIAEEQTAGRGRRGRQWVAPFGKGLYLSLTWVFEDGISAMEGLSLAIGLVIAKALSQFGVQDVGLKWPNDIMVGGAKLGGVLIEMQMDGDGRCLVVIGVGLNLAKCPDLKEGLQREIASVEDCMGKSLTERNRLGAMVVSAMTELLEGYRAGSFAALRSAWCERDVLQGRQVNIEGSDITGEATGVDPHGALLVKVNGVLTRINSGEVSLRLA